MQKTSRVLLLDAKHIKIRGKKYCEYLAYDSQLGLAHRHLRKGSECTWGYRIILTELRGIGYRPVVVVSDGGTGIFSALRAHNIIIHQRCHVHILRDVRTGLKMSKKNWRKDRRKYFIYRYIKLVLDARSEIQLHQRFSQLQRLVLQMHNPHGQVEKNTLKAFIKNLDLAFTFLSYENIYSIPNTTNQIEGYISRLNARLKTTRGLKSPTNVELLLNAIHYYLRR